jgi:hypothetical protein
LTNDLLNPSIYATGTFNEITGTLITGQYGFGGWTYGNGVDLSKFKYLVAKLGSVTSSGAVFRVFDENSYWSKPAEVTFGSNKQVVINLANSYKTGTTTMLNPAHIYIAGIWSMGGSPIVISDVYVTNNSDYSKPTSVEKVFNNFQQISLSPNPSTGKILIGIPGKDASVTVDVLSLNGVVQYKKIVSVPSDRITQSDVSELPAGVYFVHVHGDNINQTVKLIKK